MNPEILSKQSKIKPSNSIQRCRIYRAVMMLGRSPDKAAARVLLDSARAPTQNVSAPYNNVGAFEMVWTPLPGPEEEDAGKDIMDVETEDDLIGKPWTYR